MGGRSTARRLITRQLERIKRRMTLEALFFRQPAILGTLRYMSKTVAVWELVRELGQEYALFAGLVP